MLIGGMAFEEGEIIRPDDGRLGQRGSPDDSIPEFPDIARPAILLQKRLGALGEGFAFRLRLAQEIPREGRDVFGPFA